VMCDNNTIEVDNIKFSKSGTNTDLFLKEMTIEEYTNHIIKSYLEKYNNNVLLVAKKLDIGKSTIYRLLKDNNLSNF